jgi:hypothetical protein
MTLKQRFETFIKTFDGFEDIDLLLKANSPIGKNRADYLLQGRRVIVEQKSLDIDPISRPQNYADKLMAQGRLIAFGKVSTRMFSEDIQREIFLDLGRNLDAIVAKGDRQTEDTRQIFSIPDAMGVLVILNQKARILHPQVIHYGLANVLQKRAADGSLRYPANDGVILIPEAHAMNTRHGPRIHLIHFTSPHGRANKEFVQFCDLFFEAWARFNNLALIKTDRHPTQPIQP